MKRLFLYTSALALLVIRSAGWEAQVAHGDDESELAFVPKVKQLKSVDGFILVEVTNPTKHPLTYFGYAKDLPQLFQKEWIEGKWTAADWDWCGTGMSRYTLQGFERIEFKIFDRPVLTQSFTLFRNPEDPDQFSLVKLTESGQ